MPRFASVVVSLVLVGSSARAEPILASGVVTDGVAPVEGALVCGVNRDADGRVAMATASCAVTDATGAFEIDTTVVPDGPGGVGEIVAGAEGHRTASATLDAGAMTGVTLVVEPLPADDVPAAGWWQPRPTAGGPGCSTCHTTIVEQWSTSRHAAAVTDPFVLDLYDGTSATGEPGVAPGYKLDHDDAGPCGACHAATASWEQGQSVDLHEVPPEHTAGVFCETCHKVRHVETGAAPGGLGALEYLRPGYGDGLGGYAPFAFGPYPNVLTGSMESSYAPWIRRPELCAACHQYANDQGVVVMDTFTDWQAVGDPTSTVPCQGCHMRDLFGLRPGQTMEWIVDDPTVRAASAQRRDPADVARHEVWGGIEYAPHAMDLVMRADLEGDEIVVNASLMNVGANHRVPTGMPFREMILVVSAVPEGGGDPLELVAGPVVGARGGDLAGAPGKLYAKSLGDAAGNLTFAFWDATELLEDTRLATAEMDDLELRFAAPPSGTVQVTARVLYRRFSHSLAEAKGWDMGEREIAMDEDTVVIGGGDGGAGDAGAPDATPADGGSGTEFREGCVCRAAGAPGRPPPRWQLLIALAALAALGRRRS